MLCLRSRIFNMKRIISEQSMVLMQVLTEKYKGINWTLLTKSVYVTVTVVHFKRLGSRHIYKEIEIPYCVFGFNGITCKTGLKHIQTLTHKCNIVKEKHFEAI